MEAGLELGPTAGQTVVKEVCPPTLLQRIGCEGQNRAGYPGECLYSG